MSNSQDLFIEAAQYYAKYRQRYTSEFFQYLIQTFSLDGTGRLLDLGCGTGQLAIPLSPHFQEVIGIDPEQGMLDEAQKAVGIAGIQNIRWELGKAEDISSDLGIFQLTVMGASFHWMEREKVLQKVYDLTQPKGGVVIVYDTSGSIRWNDAELDGWLKVRRDTIKKYLGEERRAGNSLYIEPERPYQELLDESFGNHEEWEQSYTRTWTIDSIIGFLYSTSFAAPRLFGDQRADFEQDLTTELLRIEPSGVFKEEAQIKALVARKA